jgi:hypothetical protein
MNTILEHIEFVKSQIDHYDRMAVKSRSNSSRLGIYIEVSAKLRKLLEYLDSELARQATLSESPSDNNPLQFGALSKLPPDFLSNPFSLSASDIEGFPAELIEELGITPGDKLEIAIVELIKAAGGSIILGKLIAGLYHMTGEIHQRVALTAKLYRMSKKGLVFSVPNKKGYYTTTKPENVDSEQLEMDDGSDLA